MLRLLARLLVLLPLLLPLFARAACPAAPAPIRDIEANSFYTDEHHSLIDKALEKQYHDNIKPLEDYLRKVAALADQRIDKRDDEAGRCAISWLDAWATGGALQGRMINGRGDTQAQFERKWLLAGLSLAYLKVRELATPEQAQHIAAWMQDIADQSLALFDSPKHKRNNHYYWVGLAVMGTAVATDSAAHLIKARAVFDKALDDIADDGSLPMEMDRAGMALHYHNFALAPLVLMAELAKHKGEDWYARRDQRLSLLIARTASGIEDPAWFQQRTGVKQKPVEGAVKCWALLAGKAELAPPGACRYNHFGGSVVSLAAALHH
ncbi:alginate lyase family protein [Uliginosibacterium sediminicola]|uniref:Alginate lyase family protein n=1 Tax=Uliginosibacterium sediminicola TaxID=2024550 RepID=A0ABU9YXQ4_9RHOO